ncbi:MAG TPA: MltA domain-containing protein [Caulobacteraceae bacterium]|jgi:membrane-bound lytic murein transglycosylase A
MRGALAAFAAALAVAGCATPAPSYPPARDYGPPPAPYATRGPTTPVEAGLPLSSLPGWAQEDHLAAFVAYRNACQLPSAPLCPEARALNVITASQARAFFEQRFRAEPVANQPTGPGLLTAYFSPEYPARWSSDAVYSAPARSRPSDLVQGQPYAARAEIEGRYPEGALAWLAPEDLFFLQIQGSGTLVFPDGSRRRLVYAADNGRPFVGIAKVMRERGLLADNQTSGDAIRSWLADHRGPEAQAVMNENPRYIFFRMEADDGREPLGAAGVPLPPGRAIAVDPAHHGYGTLFWLDAQAPALAGSFPVYRRLVTALDTGGAIKGPVRADLYMGRGAAAGAEAGRVRHQLRMYRLVPR